VTGRHLITLNESGRSPDRNGITKSTPQEPFLAASKDPRVTQEAVIRARLVDMPAADSRQLVEQPLRLFEIGRVETFGEPAVDGRE
jgi:hypothetical protein